VGSAIMEHACSAGGGNVVEFPDTTVPHPVNQGTLSGINRTDIAAPRLTNSRPGSLGAVTGMESGPKTTLSAPATGKDLLELGSHCKENGVSLGDIEIRVMMTMTVVTNHRPWPAVVVKVKTATCLSTIKIDNVHSAPTDRHRPHLGNT
jgi:hypothetical protein